ncbi:alkyl sulfatase dimerization domain-containing protein [Marinobacteraceae bacterium S3BR75-40.1]
MIMGLALFALTACSDGGLDYTPEQGADAQGHTAPTQHTVKANAKVRDALPLGDQNDFNAARRGLIASAPNLVVKDDEGREVWNMPAYDFMDATAPLSVNPSLWRQGQLNNIHGLFRVTEGIYQLRGFDLSNMTLIEGESGWIVVDPLTTRESAAAAWAFAEQHLDGDKPIVAVLFTHSHIDHFGGVLGLPLEDKIRVIAPADFMDAATQENIMAGPAMARRAVFMYGNSLARSPRGHVGSGLGKSPPTQGHFGIRAPTDIIDHTGQTLTVDGVDLVFQYTPESEAPAEFTFYLPDLRAFCGAEVVSHNLHNVYTPRGAQVRDALKWSGYIDEAIGLFGDRAEVLFTSHHWPTWGQDAIVTFLKEQRDTYKYIHDQTLRLANRGLTPNEIAESMTLPPSLAHSFYNRGYYGTVRHNAKAVYQRYFGWFDGNPANLDPLPPKPAAEHYVDFMGGADAVVAKARQSFEAGEYRWTAEVLNHVVFAQPDHKPARLLLAKTYDQLGYRAESGPWRDFYLTGAYELRHGSPGPALEPRRALDLLREAPVTRFLATMAATLRGPDAVGKDLAINLHLTDREENYRLWIENAVLHHRREPLDIEAVDATLHLTHDFLLKLVTRQAGLKEMIFSDDLSVEGSRLKLLEFFSLLDRPDGDFNIVIP